MHATEVGQAAPDQSLAAIAVELRIAEFSFKELSFAAAILSMMRQDNLYRLERLAADIGMDGATARSIILNETKCASLIAEAHRIFKALIPHERVVAALLASDDKGGSA